jgi:predicted nuclease with TOPRIM domain
VGSDQPKSREINTLEQKICLLERENETLEEANEEWSEEYEKLSKDHTAALTKLNAPDSMYLPVICVLSGVLVANALSVYFSIIMSAKLQ